VERQANSLTLSTEFVWRPSQEEFLLARSRRQEEAGRFEEALASAEVLLRLAPGKSRAYDRLAYLYYRRGDLDRAVELLAEWHGVDPDDHWPLVRRAVIDQQCQRWDDCSLAIDQALARTQGQERAAVAFLGGRLALASQRHEEALRRFEQCLQEE